MAEIVDQPAEGQLPAPKDKAKEKKDKPAKKQKSADDFPPPVLIELVFTGSAIFLVVTFLTISAVSWFSGTTPLDFALRAGVSVLSLGGLLSLVTRQVSTGVLEAGAAEIEEEQKKALIDEAQDNADESLPEAQ